VECNNAMKDKMYEERTDMNNDPYRLQSIWLLSMQHTDFYFGPHSYNGAQGLRSLCGDSYRMHGQGSIPGETA
jgi:hypothetical protein